jgi:hypothetical protein
MSTDNPLYPFQVSTDQLEEHLEQFVRATVASLSSFYLELPRGKSFLDYEQFRTAYEELRAATGGFTALDRHSVREAVATNGVVLVVLRCIVGLTPAELADAASDASGLAISQSFARAQDQRARQGGNLFARPSPNTAQRLIALIDAACKAIERGPERPNPQLIHRLNKVDTAEGLVSVQRAASQGVDYSALLYERMLGRPFTTHRDSVSEAVGDIVERAVIDELEAAHVPYHKTRRAEVVPGFDQAPDFLVPDKDNIRVVIEAKLTQDDGTARNKVTRVQHLDRLSEGGRKFEVVACIDGRGFKIRRQDMRKLIRATRGKVFTITTMPYLVEQTHLKSFARPAQAG